MTLDQIAFWIPLLLWGAGVSLISRLGETRFFYRLGAASLVCAIVGLPVGLRGNDWFVAVVSLLPLVFLGWYQLCRRYYLNRYGDEPYITSAASVSGSPVNPFDYLGAPRPIRIADFVFSFGVVLLPILLALCLAGLLRNSSSDA